MFPDRLKVLTVNPSGKPGKEGRGKREREGGRVGRKGVREGGINVQPHGGKVEMPPVPQTTHSPQLLVH